VCIIACFCYLTVHLCSVDSRQEVMFLLCFIYTSYCFHDILFLVDCAATDWLQGPYIYALYDSYGISTHDIERLFVAGYGSSMVFGTIVGSVADK